MRHRKLRGQLSVNDAHRKAKLRNLLLALIKYERIQTTTAKAKQLKRFAEPMIELGKTDVWTARRKVRDTVNDKDALKKLFSVFGPRFKDRKGGYTRIFKLGHRRGDAAEISLIEILPDPAKENEPRIVRRQRGAPEEGTPEAEAHKKKETKKQKKAEAEKIKKEKLQAKAESRKAKQAQDVTHAHKSQGRKTDRGTGRAKTSKKGLS